jgi:guanylate kinase/deoxycytidine triphosphate deaminase
VLVVLFGPSGVGKSSLIKVLSSQYGYDVVRTVTTRPPRASDEDRTSVSDEEYLRLAEDGAIVPMTTVFGHKYALEQANLRTALASRTHVYLLDFALENVQDISALGGNVLGVLVMSPSESELKDRLLRHGRDDRVVESIRQHSYCLANIKKGLPVLIGDRVVVNGELKIASDTINRLISTATGQRDYGDHFGFMDDMELLRSLNEGVLFERGTWSEDCIHQASYGLRIDTEAQVSRAASESLTGRRDYQILRVGGIHPPHFELAPGDTALFYSAESFQLRPNILAITVPRGFLVAQSLSPGASYVDPGFTGKFCIPITNTSSRVVRVPAEIQAVRVLFFRLQRDVDKAWSPADATSLKSELDAAPGTQMHTAEELRNHSLRKLVQLLREEGQGGAQSAELFSRLNIHLVFVAAIAATWPVALQLFNSDGVQNGLAKIFTDGSSFIGNVLAGIVTAVLGLVSAKIVTMVRRAQRSRTSWQG